MVAADDDLSRFRTAWWQRLLADDSRYELTRFLVLRLLALVYLTAFLVLARQLDPLLGSRGLLPIAEYLPRVREALGAGAYGKLPTLLWLGCSDGVMHAMAWAGVVLSVAVLLGVTNAVVQVVLWALYLSFVHAGQIFYGYGWEIQLLETGLCAAFLCPVKSVGPFPRTRAPLVVVWLLRWLIVRVMLGAVLIKLRGDPCWRDLTCLDTHFETQPNPGPLSVYFHRAPHAVHAMGVLFNHVAEGVAPFFVFAFRRWRHLAGALLVALQVVLIASGNLSFLNWLTIVPALACFDDTVWERLVPGRFRARVQARLGTSPPSRPHTIAVRVYAAVVLVLSVGPVMNLFSDHQVMNTSFEPFDVVNTYGAFGSVDRERYEVVLEGTRDDPFDDGARWEQYELPCMPGDVRRRPCLVTPYHLRLDWQMWFVGNAAPRGEPIEQEPWLVHLVAKLLDGDPAVRPLFARNPFAAGPPPRALRAGIWRYRFASEPGAWWERERVGEFLPPITRDNRGLEQYLQAYGWGREE